LDKDGSKVHIDNRTNKLFHLVGQEGVQDPAEEEQVHGHLFLLEQGMQPTDDFTGQQPADVA
jgi:hypothetical protein